MQIRVEKAFRPSPTCPHCGTSMRFARSMPNYGARAPLQTFDCALCGLSVTESAELESAEHASAA